MKRRFALLLLILVVVAGGSRGSVLVTNSAARDTLSIPFMVLDSTGNAVDLSSGDSVYLVVFYPGGGIAFKDSVAHDDGSISGYDWEDFTGGRSYVFTERVSVLDGTAPVNGVYTYILTVDDNSSADLLSTYMGTFQVINAPVESSLDSASFARVAVDSLHLVIDSLLAVLDSLQSQADWVGNIRFTSTDSILRLRGLHLRGTVSGDTALAALGYGTGPGATIRSGYDGGYGVRVTGYGSYPGMLVECDAVVGTGRGLEIKSGGSGGDGVYILSHQGDGIRIYTLSGRDFNACFDSSNYLDSTFHAGLFTDSYFDSSQGAASGLSVGDIWTYGTREITGGWVDSNRAEQGGSGDSVSIARWVWNTPQGNHTGAGSFGRYLDTEISTVGSGGGLYSRTVVAIDSLSGQPIPGVRMSVRPPDQSTLLAYDVGDERGRCCFHLDADTVVLIPFVPGYSFAGSETLLVDGAGTDTVYGVAFHPGESENPVLCRVYGFLYDITGRPEVDAIVAARLPVGVFRYSSAIITPLERTTISDSLGYFALDLVPTPCLTPDTTQYEITITLANGTVFRESVIVPDQNYWQLTW